MLRLPVISLLNLAHFNLTALYGCRRAKTLSLFFRTMCENAFNNRRTVSWSYIELQLDLRSLNNRIRSFSKDCTLMPL